MGLISFYYRDKDEESKSRKQDRKASRTGKDRDDRSEGRDSDRGGKSKIDKINEEIARKVRKCKLLCLSHYYLLQSQHLVIAVIYKYDSFSILTNIFY
jgi:hypothetical protein